LGSVKRKCQNLKEWLSTSNYSRDKIMTLPAIDSFIGDENPLNTNWVTNPFPSDPLKKLSGVVRNSLGVNGECGAYWGLDVFENNQYSKIKITAQNSETEWSHKLIVRQSASEKTCYLGGCDDGTTFLIQKFITGTQTTIGSTSGLTAVVGDIWELRVVGTNLTLLQNGILRVTAVDSDITSGSAGFAIYYLNSTADDWEGGNIPSNVFGFVDDVTTGDIFGMVG
jgi:hypothetical protein